MSKKLISNALTIFILFQLSCLGDDNSTNPPPTGNEKPDINNITVQPITTQPGGTALVTVTATDPNSDVLSFVFEATGGTVAANNNTAVFTADATEGVAWVKVTVTDDDGLSRVGFVTANKRATAPLIGLGVLSLDAASSTNQCLGFTIVASEEIILLNTGIVNPIGQTFNFAGPSFLEPGLSFFLQPLGSCYTLHPGTYQFTFRVRRDLNQDPFDVVINHIQPTGAPL